MEEDTFGAISVAMRVYYSSYHLWAARHFTRLATENEDPHTGRSTFNVAHRSYVTSAIFSAVSFLEAAINEIFQDAADKHLSYISSFDTRCTELIPNDLIRGSWRCLGFLSHTRRRQTSRKQPQVGFGSKLPVLGLP